MLMAEPTPFLFQGEAATMTVLRNEAFCWGRIDFAGGRAPLDVSSGEEDLYDDASTDAAERLIELAADPTNVEQAQSWLKE